MYVSLTRQDLLGRLELTAQPLFQFGAVTLNPTLDRRVIRRQTALGEQLFDIAQRARVAKIPTHGTQNQLWRRLPPLEDCRSGCVRHDRSVYQSTLQKSQHIPRSCSRCWSSGCLLGKAPIVLYP